MTCGQRIDCTLCSLSPEQKQAWRQRHVPRWGEPDVPQPPLAFEAQGQLTLGFSHAPDGAGRVKLASEDSRTFRIRLCRGCLERVLNNRERESKCL